MAITNLIDVCNMDDALESVRHMLDLREQPTVANATASVCCEYTDKTASVMTYRDTSDSTDDEHMERLTVDTLGRGYLLMVGLLYRVVVQDGYNALVSVDVYHTDGDYTRAYMVVRPNAA